MSRKSIPSKDKSQNGLSAEEFQKQLLNWFQDRGVLSDLQAHLRHQMIVALKDTSLNIHSAGAFHQAGSPKLQAINLLVAEFLLRQQCHYTLSVFSSEVPLLRNLPEFSTAISNSTRGIENASSEEGFPGFHERDVFDILEALGYASNSEESKIINEMYEHSQGEALLTCVIRSLPNTNRAHEKDVPISQSSESKKLIEQQAALRQCSLFTEDVCNILLQSNLDAEQITLMYIAVKRIMEEEVLKTQKEEENKFQQELIVREQRIQEVWNQQDTLLQEIQRKSDEKLNEERLKLEGELNRKEAQFALLALQLKEQQNDVASRLSYIQERSDLIEQKETKLKVLRKESEEYLVKRQEQLNMREMELDKQLEKLEAETRAREQEKQELQANRLEIEAASRAIKESQSEIALLRELQKEQHLQLKAAQEKLPSAHKNGGQQKKSDHSLRKKKTEFVSLGVQVETDKHKGAIPKKRNVHQQTNSISFENQSLQTQISASDLEEVFLQLHQQNAESERHRSQHTMLGNLVDRLQQENLELRGHIEQQRHRIQELTVQTSEFMQQLSQAHNSITRMRSRPTSAERYHHGVQTSPQSSADSAVLPASGGAAASVQPSIPVMDSVPGLALGAYTYHPQPSVRPELHPVPESRPPTRGFVRSNQVGAGEESYFSRRLLPESFVPLQTSPNHREQRRKPPRRLMVHSVSSSDDSCPSPTEEMLREARRRLRRLEEETAAIDRSYQEFRLRNVGSLTNTASILFQPITNLTRLNTPNHPLPVAQNMPTRNMSPNLPVFSFPTTFSRSRLYASPLLNPFPSTTILQSGVLQPVPLFPMTRTNNVLEQSVSFPSASSLRRPTFSSLHTVATESFSARLQNTQEGRAVTTSLLSVPSLSSTRVQNGTQQNPRSTDDLTLPAGFNLTRQTRYSEEKDSFQSDSHPQNTNTSGWTQKQPPSTSLAPQMSTSVVHIENEKLDDQSKSENSDDKLVVFLHQENQRFQKSSNASTEYFENPATTSALQTASEKNFEERLLSTPSRVFKSTEHDRESMLHSTKSFTKLDEVNSLQLEQNSLLKRTETLNLTDVSKHSESNSDISKHRTAPLNSVGCDPLSQQEIQQDDLEPELQVPVSYEYVKESGQNPEKAENKCDIIDVKLPEVSMKNPDLHENDQSDNISSKSKSYTNGSRSLKSKASVESPMKTVDTNRDSGSNGSINDRMTPEKRNLSTEIETKFVSNEQRTKEDTDVQSEEVLVKCPEPYISADQQSLSSSLPSSLGSNDELSSNIVSAGEGKSDNSW